MAIEQKKIKQKLKLGAEYSARPYFFLFEEYWKPRYGKKAKPKKNVSEDKKSNRNWRIRFLSNFLLGTIFAVILTLVLYYGILVLTMTGESLRSLMDEWGAVNGFDSTKIAELMAKYIDGPTSDKIGFAVFGFFVENTKTITTLIITPILTVGFSIFAVAYFSLFIYISFGYYRFWRKNWWKEDYKALSRAQGIIDDIKRSTALMTYDDYIKDTNTWAVLLDVNYYDMLDAKKGHPGYGFSLSTFVLTNQDDIDFVIKHNKVPKHIWETIDSPFATSSGEKIDKFLKTQRVNPNDKNSNYKMSYVYGVILTWGAHSIVEGATGSGKGMTAVLPEMFANLASIEKPSIVLTFKAEFLQEYDFFAKLRGYDQWRIRLDDTPSSDSYNPIYLGYFFNMLSRQLTYGKPEKITTYTPADLENSFTLRIKRANSQQYEEFNTLFTRKDLIEAVAKYEKNDNIYKYEKLKGWDTDSLLEADFIMILKGYDTTHTINDDNQQIKNQFGVKISNVYKPLLFYPKGKLDLWNKKINGKTKKQTTKNWYRIGNFVYEHLFEYNGGSALIERKNWCKESEIKYSTEIVKLIGSLSGNENQDIWATWGEQLVTFYLSLFLELTDYVPCLTEEYFNLPSILGWVNSLNHSEDASKNDYVVLDGILKNSGFKEKWNSMDAVATIAFTTPDTQWGSILSMTSQLTSTFTSNDILPIVLRNDFNLLALSLKPTFCSLTMSKSNNLNKIMSILIKNITDSSSIILGETSDRRLPVKTLFELDEAGSGPPAPSDSLTYVSSLGRSSGCFMNLCFQDLNQINEKRYPKNSESLKKELLQNSLLKKIIGLKNDASADFWSKELGMFMSVTEGISTQEHGGADEFWRSESIESKIASQSVVEIPVFSKTDLLSKQPNQIIGRFSNYKPFILASPPFWASPFLRQINKLAKENFSPPAKPPIISVDNWKKDWYIDLIGEIKKTMVNDAIGLTSFDLENSLFADINNSNLKLKDIFDDEQKTDLGIINSNDNSNTSFFENSQQNIEFNYVYKSLENEINKILNIQQSARDVAFSDESLNELAAKLKLQTFDSFEFPEIETLLRDTTNSNPINKKPKNVIEDRENQAIFKQFNVGTINIFETALSKEETNETFKKVKNSFENENQAISKNNSLKKELKDLEKPEE